jgi:hypothetical protein
VLVPLGLGVEHAKFLSPTRGLNLFRKAVAHFLVMAAISSPNGANGAANAVSKTKLLRDLYSDVQQLKQDIEPAVQVSAWVKEQFKPTMKKMKGSYQLFAYISLHLSMQLRHFHFGSYLRVRLRFSFQKCNHTHQFNRFYIFGRVYELFGDPERHRKI